MINQHPLGLPMHSNFINNYNNYIWIWFIENIKFTNSIPNVSQFYEFSDMFNCFCVPLYKEGKIYKIESAFLK
jgi:hypothetical protein